MTTYWVEIQNTVAYAVEIEADSPKDAAEQADQLDIDQMGPPGHLDDWRYIVIDDGETVYDSEGALDER